MKWSNYLFVAVAALTLAGSTAAQQTSQRPVRPEPERTAWGPETREEKRRLREVREKQGLREAAKLYGGYIEEVSFDSELEVDSIGVLVSSAELIVRGLVTKNRSALVRARIGYPEPVETIVTDYTVQIFDVYKGDPALHSRGITVRIPGGRVEFEDGLWAEMRASGFMPPLNQDEFVLFLNRHESAPGVYTVTFNRFGLFEVKSGGKVIPRAGSASYLGRHYNGDLRRFLQQLHAHIAKEKRGRNDDR